MFRNSIYTVTGSQGYTYCNLQKSIVIELNQTYELNTFVFWLWDRSWRTYDLVVYISYEGVESIILDNTAINGIVEISFPDQLVKQFRIYNRNGSTANLALIIIKAKAFYNL